MKRLQQSDFSAFKIAAWRLIDSGFGRERFNDYRHRHQDWTMSDSSLEEYFEDWKGEEVSPKQLARDYIQASELEEHLGPKSRGGRPKAHRRQLSIRIRQDILERLEPGAARKIRDLVETTYAKNELGMDQ